jgi:polysaccharide export outer membrane protein
MLSVNKFQAWWLVAVALCIAVLGCSRGQDYKSLEVDSYSVSSLRSEEADAFNDQIFSAAQINADPSEYLLGSGDLMQVTVYECDKLNTTVRVSSRGYVTLPLLGQMTVKGLTAREAEIQIEKAYKKNYLQDPHVSIFYRS